MKRIPAIALLVLIGVGIGALGERASLAQDVSLARTVAYRCDTGWTIPGDVCAVTPGRDPNALPTPMPIGDGR